MRTILCALFLFLLLILAGCGKVTEEFLIDGNWIATAGYEDGEPEGEPHCIDFIMGGLEFKEDGVVYSSYFDEDYTYYLEKGKLGIELFIERDRDYLYYIDKLNENGIGLTGGSRDPNTEFCYLERK